MTKQAADRSNGSPRHRAKTHGSHNGRWHSWPHVSDVLDRPPPYRTPTVLTVKRERKARHPGTSSREGKRTGRGRWSQDQPSTPIYLVSAERAHDGRTISVRVTARCEEEAAGIGRELLVMDSMSTVRDVRVEVVVGGGTPLPAASVDHNPWVHNKRGTS